MSNVDILRTKSLRLLKLHQEEDEHPWQEPLFLLHEMPGERDRQGVHVRLGDNPLMRLIDHESVSQPDSTEALEAPDNWTVLDSAETRTTVLLQHSDPHLSHSTPFITFTSDIAKLEQTAGVTVTNAIHGVDSRKLIVIDPMIRSAKGLPTIYYPDEIEYYKLDQAAPMKDWDRYLDCYLCLWAVTPDEVSGVYDFNNLLNEGPQWYRDVILQDFIAHRENSWVLQLFAAQ